MVPSSKCAQPRATLCGTQWQSDIIGDVARLTVLVTDWSGQDYAEISSLHRAMITEAVAKLAFAAHDRVLDVGCGDGLLTGALAGLLTRWLSRSPKYAYRDDDPNRCWRCHVSRTPDTELCPKCNAAETDRPHR